MKKTIKWRLKEQPTTEGLRELVKDQILTKDEAREILFSTETPEDIDTQAQQDEIKFLRDLVKQLSRKGTATVVYPAVWSGTAQTPLWSKYYVQSGLLGTAVNCVASSNSTTLTVQ